MVFVLCSKVWHKMKCNVDFTVRNPHTWRQSYAWYSLVVRVTFRLLYLPVPIVQEARWLLIIVLEIVKKRKSRPYWQYYFRSLAYMASVYWRTHFVTIPLNSNPQTDISKMNSVWNWRVKCSVIDEIRNVYTVLVGIRQRQNDEIELGKTGEEQTETWEKNAWRE